MPSIFASTVVRLQDALADRAWAENVVVYARNEVTFVLGYMRNKKAELPPSWKRSYMKLGENDSVKDDPHMHYST